MKFILKMLLIIVLMLSAFSEVDIKLHSTHVENDLYLDHVKMSHNHSTHKSDSSSKNNKECPHVHSHCSSICLGILFPKVQSKEVSSFKKDEFKFFNKNLVTETFTSSIDRPPILES